MGRGFVEDLSALTGADIAASSDLTGAAALGGDWQLEVSTGPIDSFITLDATVLDIYSHVLDSVNCVAKAQSCLGNDNIDGKGKDDTITPGLGDDVVEGGSGDDRFIFDDDFGKDRITDVAGEDELDFSAVDRPLTFVIKADGKAEVYYS